MSRHIDRGVTKIYMLGSAPLDLTAPTIAELTGGTDLTADENGVFASSGWSPSTNIRQDPTMSSPRDVASPGTSSWPESGFQAYDPSSGSLIDDGLLVRGTEVWIVWAPHGGSSGDESEVYPCQVNEVFRDHSGRFGETRSFTMNFAITDDPTKGSIGS